MVGTQSKGLDPDRRIGRSLKFLLEAVKFLARGRERERGANREGVSLQRGQQKILAIFTSPGQEGE
jgi:hypothetical protein